MAWRFKASKYKNAAPKFPKREEWITELPIGTLQNSQGNHIKSSAVYIAFNQESSGGGSVGILPLSCSGQKGRKVSNVHAHTDFATDFDFSPFDDYLLATGSTDCTLKVWMLPEDTGFESESNPVVKFCEEQKIENVLWHPSAHGILAASSQKTIKVYDVTASQEKYALNNHHDTVQSISWKGDGTLLLSSSKDKTLRIFDPRAGKLSQETAGHQNIRDSRVLWMGNKDIILSTGFQQSRKRCIGLWDTRNFSTCLHSIDLDNSTGILMPFFDPDTNMVFIVGKGDNILRFMELTDKEPYLTEGSMDRTEQIKGVCMVPKRAMDVMNGEVNRLLCLIRNAIIPAPYIVPRKTYRDFHDDLYPDTTSMNPAMSADQWLEGQNIPISLISLNPAKKQVVLGQRGRLFGNPANSDKSSPVKQQESQKNLMENIKPAPALIKENKGQSSTQDSTHKQELENGTRVAQVTQTNKSDQAASAHTSDSNKPSEVVTAAATPPKPVKVFTGVRQSKFRHLKGEILHKNLHIQNLRNVSTTVPGESDMFAANTKRCVVPLQGPGGILQVLELNKPGKLPDVGVPVVQNGSPVMDFVWDPFNNCRLVVACDDAKIRVWNFPEDGVKDDLSEPDMYLKGHTEKIYLVRFHPLAEDVLISASYDMTVRIWDLKNGSEVMQLDGHTDSVFCVAWSPDGKLCATACKDGKIRVFDPRESTQPLREGPGPAGRRGARIGWALDGKYIFVSGFDRGKNRQVIVYDSTSLGEPLAKAELDSSPSILVPFYDEDSSVLFLQGRLCPGEYMESRAIMNGYNDNKDSYTGDRQMYSFEICEDDDHLYPVSGFTCPNQSQALSFLPKNVCDPKKVEFAFAWRLTQNSLEPMSFTVPRVKTEFFQDDVFPETRVTWEATMSSSEWLAGGNKASRRISMRPPNMTPLSEAPEEAPKVRKYESYNPETYKTDAQKKEELLSAMDKKLALSESPLPQDLAEGVDDDEWDD